MKDNREYLISITWGRSSTYNPYSMEKINWDGTLSINGGEVIYLDKIHYKFIMFAQSKEVPERIYDIEWALPLRYTGSYLSWKSSEEPGSAGTLEGLRVRFSGNEDTVICLQFIHTVVRFRLGELLNNEYLQFHAGGKYSGMPVDVFLGPDARPRLSRTQYIKKLENENRAGYLLVPDDFLDCEKMYFYAMYGAKIEKGKRISTSFGLTNARKKPTGNCKVRIQITAMIDKSKSHVDDPVTLSVTINRSRKEISHVFTTRIFLPKLEEIYLDVPWSDLAENGNTLMLSYEEGRFPLLLHRVFIGEDRSSLAGEISKLPKLPQKRRLHIGTETCLLTPANGDIDQCMEIMYEEELGDYLTLRERAANASEPELRRWIDKIAKLNFYVATACAPKETEQLFEHMLGERYTGEQAHEMSALIYGFGTPDAYEMRKDRTMKVRNAI